MARVERLDRTRFEDAVGVLRDAFRDYPAMTYSLKGAGQAYDATLSELVGYFTDLRFALGWPVLGAADGTDLVGIALVNAPRQNTAVPSLQPRFARWRDGSGREVLDRFKAFNQATAPFEPETPFYFLSLLAVPPRYQGKGYARLLLEAVHDISRDDPASDGVVLTTETADNVRLYEHFGYRVLGQAWVEEVPSWLLYREDQAFSRLRESSRGSSATPESPR